MNEQVEEYIQKQKSPQKEIIQKLRNILFETFPYIKEDFKLGVPWYEDKYYLVALKDHVNIGFSIKNLSNKDLQLFEGSGKTMKHIKVFSVDEIDRENIVKLLTLVWNN